MKHGTSKSGTTRSRAVASGGSSGAAELRWHERLVVAIALVPLVYLPLSQSLYDLPKQVLLTLIVCAFVLVHGLAGVRKGQGFAVSRSPLLLPAVAYLGCLALSSTLQAANVHDALSGALQQGLPIVLALLILTRGLRETAVERFVSVAVGVGAVAVLVACVQYAGVSTDGVGLTQVRSPASFFGNKNMAAEYVLYVLPLLVYRWESTRFRRAYVPLLVAVLAMLFNFHSKAVWVGSAVLLPLLGLRLVTRARLKNLVTRERWVLLAAVLQFLVLVNLPALSSSPDAGARTSTFVHSGTGRMAQWVNTLPMLAKQPLLGVGPDNWGYWYPLYSTDEGIFSIDEQAAQPHNDFVQIAGETGILGLAAFLWMLWALGGVAWKAVGDPRAAEGRGRAFYFVVAMLAMLLTAQFAMPLHLAPGAAYFWVLAALVLLEAEKRRGVQGAEPWPAFWIPGRQVAVLLVVLAATLTASRETRILVSDLYRHVGEAAFQEGRYPDAVQAFDASLESYPHQYWTYARKGLVLALDGKPREAVPVFEQALTYRPYHPNTLLSLASAHRDSGRLDEAVRTVRRAIEYVPHLPESHYLLGIFLRQQGDLEGALAEFRRAKAFDPRFRDADPQIEAVLRQMAERPRQPADAG